MVRPDDQPAHAAADRRRDVHDRRGAVHGGPHEHGPLDSDQGDDRTEEDARHRQDGGLRIGVRAAAAAHIARLAIASVRGVL